MNFRPQRVGAKFSVQVLKSLIARLIVCLQCPSGLDLGVVDSVCRLKLIDIDQQAA